MNESSPPSAGHAVRCRSLFLVFFQIGLFTFGGGFAMIPLIRRELAGKRKWVGDAEIVDVLALAQTVPGAVAVNAATLIGKRLAGIPGALAATAGVILPSFLLITLMATFFASVREMPVVQAVFRGLRPAVVALMAVAVVEVGRTAMRDILGWGVFLVAILLVVIGKVHVLLVLLGAAGLGLLLQFVFPGRMSELIHRGETPPTTRSDVEETPPLPSSDVEETPPLPSSDVEETPLVPRSDAEEKP